MPKEDAKVKSTDAKTPTGGAGEGKATATARAPSGAGQSAAEGGGPAEGLLDQAKQTTGQAVEQVQQQATTRLDRQKETAAAGLKSVADAVRQMGQNLRGQEQGGIAQYAAEYSERAAEQIERFTDYLREHDLNQLVGEVEGFARRQPALFFGGSFLLGFAGARFLKSSSPARDVTGGAPDAGRALPPASGRTAGGSGRGGVTISDRTPDRAASAS
jgi:hypothetical protein